MSVDRPWNSHRQPEPWTRTERANENGEVRVCVCVRETSCEQTGSEALASKDRGVLKIVPVGCHSSRHTVTITELG